MTQKDTKDGNIFFRQSKPNILSGNHLSLAISITLDPDPYHPFSFFLPVCLSAFRPLAVSSSSFPQTVF